VTRSDAASQAEELDMANQQSEQDAQAQIRAILSAPLLYHAEGMQRVTARRDIRYRGAAASDLRLDVYTPADLAEGDRRPAVVFVHGGPIAPDLPLAPTEWGVYRGYGALAAASGWVGVTFGHRFYDYEKLPQAADDIAAAIAYTRDHADELGMDRDRLCLWAFSGGGAFLAEALRARSPAIRCLVAYYTLLDLRPLASEDDLASATTMETLARFSPLAVIEGSSPRTTPMLIARAGRDHPALNAQLDAFAQAALAANMPLDLLNHPEGEHGFDTRTDDARTREIITHTLAFLHARLNPGPDAQ